MGYVPDYRFYFDKLVKFYADKGLNMFYFDAHLSNPIQLQSSLRAFIRNFSNMKYLKILF